MFSPKEMAEDQLALLPDGSGFWNISSTSPKLSQHITQMIPLESTGLHDKNGVEIFEGDVLGYTSQGKQAAKVFEREGCFRVTDRNTTRCLQYHLEKYKCEVIGNIWENPELLK
jgi:uncharacterized phage protein (TIGR01671 family)